MIWLLILLGLITYFIVQQRVAGITRTPAWILWLVMMTPALVLSAWTLIYRDRKPIPLELVIGLFVSCLFLYWTLIQWGRITSSSTVDTSTATDEDSAAIAVPETKTETMPLRPIDKAEEVSLQGCFPWSIYYLQNIEYRPQAVICRGQLRTTPEVAYQTIRENIAAQFGDRFFVIFQEGQNGKPFFALVPNPQAQRKQNEETLTRPGLALGLLLVSLLTSTLVGMEIAGVTSQQFQDNPALFWQGLPYAIALVTIFGVRELGHYWGAKSHKVRATLPYFIPVPFFIGTFGAFIQIRAPIPNRKALFDLGWSGSLAGFAVTLPFLLWGLAHSTVVPLPDKPEQVNLQALNPTFSLLLTLLSRLMLGNELTAKSAIQLDPVAVAGFIGLALTAFHLMPIGQLDGGRIVHAMYGQRSGAAIGQIARLLLLLLSIVQPSLLLWAIILFLIPVNDEPALNDVTELDNRRDLLGLVALGILLLIILPAPRFVTSLLNL